MKTTEVLKALAISGYFVALYAQGGPPFITDDPEPVDYQHWEVYLASMDTKNQDGWNGTAPHIEVNYGAVTNLQLHLIAPLAYDGPNDGAAHFGYGDTELGAKFRFLEETEHLPQIGTFPLLEVPTGNASHSLGSGHLQIFLPVWMQKGFDRWTVYGGGGYGINPGPGNRSWGFVGEVTQYQVLTNVAVAAEFYHQTAQQEAERSNTAFNLGAIVDFSDHHHLLFSVGRSISGPNRLQLYLAYQLTFDNSVFHFRNSGGR